MQEWWMSLDVFMKSLWIIALFTSLVFIVQTVLTFAGADSDVNADLDFGSDSPADGFQLSQYFTFRNFINFFLGFSWSAIAFSHSIRNTWLLLAVAVLTGLMLVSAVIYLFKWLSGMEQTGNISIRDATGCTGIVYLTIPAERTGEGKVQIAVRGAIREYNAVTDGEKLANGTPIQVKKVLTDNLLLIEKQY